MLNPVHRRSQTSTPWPRLRHKLTSPQSLMETYNFSCIHLTLQVANTSHAYIRSYSWCFGMQAHSYSTRRYISHASCIMFTHLLPSLIVVHNYIDFQYASTSIYSRKTTPLTTYPYVHPTIITFTGRQTHTLTNDTHSCSHLIAA